MTQPVSLPSQVPNFLTLKDVMAHLHKSRSSIYRLIKNQQLPAYKAGARLLFYPEDVVAVLQRVA